MCCHYWLLLVWHVGSSWTFEGSSNKSLSLWRFQVSMYVCISVYWHPTGGFIILESIDTVFLYRQSQRDVSLGTLVGLNRTVSCQFLIRRSRSDSSTIMFLGPLFSSFISALARGRWMYVFFSDSVVFTIWYSQHIFCVPRVNFNCLDSTVTKKCVVTIDYCWFDM